MREAGLEQVLIYTLGREGLRTGRGGHGEGMKAIGPGEDFQLRGHEARTRRPRTGSTLDRTPLGKYSQPGLCAPGFAPTFQRTPVFDIDVAATMRLARVFDEKWHPEARIWISNALIFRLF